MRNLVALFIWGAASCTGAAEMVNGGQLREPIPSVAKASAISGSDAYRLANRITWGATPSAVDVIRRMGWQAYVADQLNPVSRGELPAEVQAQISTMTVVQKPMSVLVQDMAQRLKATDTLADDGAKQSARQAYQVEMNRLAREAASRHWLRALYSPQQVKEQMVWFWLNHFSVHQSKANLRAMVADYEESAIRPYALGRFRDLLGAVVYHPAMLRYLDNPQNAVGRINENLARELMELHTLGVDAGYTQTDVQELARVLTGVGVNAGPEVPVGRKTLLAGYVRRGLFEFNPNRHDFGRKYWLGQTLQRQGLAELDEVLDRLARHPATARFISKKLATYWLSDEPPASLVQEMAHAFERSGGDIARTLAVLFHSAEFMQSTQHRFKDPARFVISAVRMAYDAQSVTNMAPLLNWINRLGQPLYGRPTPDGYPLQESAWSSPAQLTTRFEVAKAIGAGSAGLVADFVPQLNNDFFLQTWASSLSPATRQTLGQASTPQEWNTFLLASPEMMYR